MQRQVGSELVARHMFEHVIEPVIFEFKSRARVLYHTETV